MKRDRETEQFANSLKRYYPWPSNETFLELHARRITLNNSLVTDEDEQQCLWDFCVESAIEEFVATTGQPIYLLGRSNRHVCVDDIPENSRHFDRLQRLANKLCDEAIAAYNGYVPNDGNA
jgi:hypothetical protein